MSLMNPRALIILRENATYEVDAIEDAKVAPTERLIAAAGNTTIRLLGCAAGAAAVLSELERRIHAGDEHARKEAAGLDWSQELLFQIRTQIDCVLGSYARIGVNEPPT